MNIDIKKLPNSEIKIEGEIAVADFEKYRAKAVSGLSKDVEIPGFRKGQAPEEILIKNLGEHIILEEMANLAIGDAYPKILMDNKIDAIGRPVVAITKIAKDNPLGFTINTAVFPEIKLPDYKKVAKNLPAIEKKEVSDKEVDDAILEIRKMRHSRSIPHEHKKAEEHSDDEHKNIKEEDLPPLDDEFVKSLGGFENIKAFTEKLKENIALEKEREVMSKKRIALVENLLKETEIEIPEILVSSELEKMIARFKADVERSGVSFEEYQEHSKKTEEDIKKEWRVDAEKRVKSEILLSTIAKEEKIVPEKDIVEKEVAHIKEHHKEADENQIRDYVTYMLTNEKVFEVLLK